MNKNTVRLLTLTSFFMIGFATIASAQAPPPGAPIDGGASLLLGGAAYLGYRKLKERREAKN